MKNMMRKDFYMEIRKTLGRFISIFFIVALGVAFYAGIRASEPSMRISGDAYFDRTKLMDIKVMGTMGLTQSDIRAIGQVKGIENVEGAYSKDVLCPVEDTEKAVHMMSLQDNFNEVAVSEGRLPEKAGECLIDVDFKEFSGYKVGDRITFRSGDDKELTESLTTDTYTVVGIGSTPLYISFSRGNATIGNGELSGFVMVDKSSFDMEVYTEAYVRAIGTLDEVSYTSEYNKLSDAAKDAVDGIKKERCSIRRQDIVGEANEELADAEETLQEESGKLSDAKQELSDAKSTAATELEDARKQLADAQVKLEESKQQIADGERQIGEGKTQLVSQQNLLNSKRSEYNSGVAELNKQAAELEKGENQYLSEYAQYMPLIIAGKEEIAKAKDKISQDKKTLEEKKGELEEGLKKVEEGLKGIEDLQSLADGIEATDQGIVELEAKLTQGEDEYKKIIDIPEEERTEEQVQFVLAWEGTKEGMNASLALLKEQQAVLARKMEAAGFASVADLKGKLTELEPMKKKLEEKENELKGNREQLLEAEKQLAAGEQQLQEKEKELLSQENQLQEAGKKISAGKAEVASARAQLSEAGNQLKEGQRQIDVAWATIRQQEKTLSDGKTQIVEGERELSEGRTEYEKAVQEATIQIQDGETQIQDGEEKLIEAKQELADAKAEIEKIENPKWYVQDRDEALTNYSGYGENADRMRAIGKVFPAVFFLVAALISLTTMTRMIEEQRIHIGTMKALGYGKLSIAKKYIYYALLATFGGSVFGILIGEKIFPFIIIYAYKIMYTHIPDILVPYHMEYAIQATAIAVLCTLLATVLSCYKELAAQPAELMRPPSPKQGKRIMLERVGWLWRRLNFTWKSSIRNLIRYKKRFFMTVFGIGGCMALLLVGFGLKDCIFEIMDLQYDKIQFYDASVYMDDTIGKDEKKDVLNYLSKDSSVESHTQVRMQKEKIKSGDKEESVYLTVPKDMKVFKDYVSLHSRTKDESYSLKKDQLILTEKAAQTLKVEAGDTIILKNEDKGDKEVTIGAICENYMGHYLYMAPELYEELYGAPAKYNSILYIVKGREVAQIEKIGEKLLTYDSIMNVSYTSSLKENLDDMLRTLNLVVIVLIVSAGMLAFVVLYNLNNINIAERKRELATIKVLGFYDMEVASYVYRENVLLTIIGALAGMGIGRILLQFVVTTVEVNEAMFGRDIYPISYIYSLLFTIGFSMFVNWVMYFKLKKIDMVESLKSIE